MENPPEIENVLDICSGYTPAKDSQTASAN